MSEKQDDGEHERARNAHIDALLERDERERIIDEWLGKKWGCFWGILTKLGLILALAAAAVELPGKVARFFGHAVPPSVDRRTPDRPPYFGGPTRGH
jgi:hypothetical protein